jgi:hypothetical protein
MRELRKMITFFIGEITKPRGHGETWGKNGG